jgi:hypothetical protein
MLHPRPVLPPGETGATYVCPLLSGLRYVWFTISGVPHYLVQLACNRAYLYMSMLNIMHVRVPLWFVSVPSLYISFAFVYGRIDLFYCFILFFYVCWELTRSNLLLQPLPVSQ